MSLLRSTAVVGGYTLLSRILGFTRDILIAAALGAGPVADAFFVAFRFPNFFRRLSAEGAFNAAFVPLFAGFLAREGRRHALRFAERTLSVMLTVLTLLVLLVELFMPAVIQVIAPGFTTDAEKFSLAVQFTRITFPYILLISLVALMGGMLNSVNRFAAMAAAPVLLNVCLIAFVLVGASWMPTVGHALAWGVVVAGMVQFVWLAYSLHRAGLALRLRWPRFGPQIRRLFALMLPAALGGGIIQINQIVDVILASMLPVGAISFLYYGDRVAQLPLGVVGAAAGTALLPMLSRQIRNGETDAALDSQNRALEITMLLTLPAAAGLILLSGPIMAVLFQHGAFGPAEAKASAQALAAYAVGLPAFVLIKVLNPGYFARQDTVTPIRVGILAMILHVLLSLTLMQLFAHTGIALASALSSWSNAAMLAILLWRRGHLRPDARLRRRSLGTALATLFMTAGLMALLGPAGAVHDWALPDRIGLLVAAMGVGMISFAVAAWGVGAVNSQELRQAFRRRA